MHTQFLSYLADPVTREPLGLEVEARRGDFIDSGWLTSSRNAYPIVRGIPRFVAFDSENYAGSFGYQWQRWPRLQFESENIGGPMEGYTRRMWERITGFEEAEPRLHDQTIVDIGCGPGRFVDVARSKGARVIGIDYSAAVEAARQNFEDDPEVCILQADALNPPLRSGKVDGAFSIGVLHHTPDPRRGVEAALDCIVDGGWFSLCVYGKGGYYDFPTVQAWRKAFSALWPFCRHYPPLVYAYLTTALLRPIAKSCPLLGKAMRVPLPFINLPDRRWSMLDTFDSVTPSYQSAHECYEVYSWLREAGFTNVAPTNWAFTSFRGTKASGAPVSGTLAGCRVAGRDVAATHDRAGRAVAADVG